MKKILAATILLIAIILGTIFFQNYLSGNPILLGGKATATINNHKFNLKIAKTSEEKEVGLSKEKNLPQNEGMLFPFEKEDYYSFWMKNMQIPIDIIFIKDNKIVNIFINAQPPKTTTESLPIYQPKAPADSVLEINANLSSKYNFKEGDIVKYENIGTD